MPDNRITHRSPISLTDRLKALSGADKITAPPTLAHDIERLRSSPRGINRGTIWGLLDTSISMDGQPLSQAKQGFEQFAAEAIDLGYLVGLIAFGDWKIPLYSWIVIYITGHVIDLIVEGVNYDKSLFIISDKYEEIRSKILDDLKRGGTFISGKGMYGNEERSIIFTVVSRRELAMLKDFIKEIDPNAFLTVIDTREILGKGFKSLKDEN